MYLLTKKFVSSRLDASKTLPHRRFLQWGPTGGRVTRTQLTKGYSIGCPPMNHGCRTLAIGYSFVTWSYSTFFCFRVNRRRRYTNTCTLSNKYIDRVYEPTFHLTNHNSKLNKSSLLPYTNMWYTS